MNNPDCREVDLNSQEGLEKLKIKAKYYGHYAEFLRVTGLIKVIEDLKEKIKELESKQQ